ncbi:hypothetical protein M413DRAFT_85733 [Hebeloma cylindrosporum]|uniref:Monopolin complex subunit Csm1/Pcs1 C-terminal domain-containing protein n=1 Tax=Hebeloma cylindrosporum TaxID=76867 RepID=A0A0C3CJ96_HEBCY|nr:hypothetical protein M413DRAFT_85733 [Hebeloma cylindrosporum h7]
MSDSDDFGGLAPTTPNIPRLKSASSKPNSNRAAEAGPSKSAGTGAAPKTGAKKRPAPVQDESDGDEVREVAPPKKSARSTAASRKLKPKPTSKQKEDPVEEEEQGAVSVDDDEVNDVEVLDHLPTKNTGSKKPAATSDGVNGHAKGGGAAAKGKGKAKAKPAAASSKPRVLKQEPPEVMDVDSIYGAMEVEEQEQEAEEIEDQRMTVVQPINAFGKSGVKGGRGGQVQQHAKHGEEARLRERLRQAELHVENLKGQVEELCQVRRTEPEQLLERLGQQHQNEIQGRDALIKDLTTKLARKEPFFRAGKSAGFEIMTRDEAEREMEELQATLKQCKEVLKERDRQLKEKDEQAEELRQEVNNLRIELKTENERAKTLAANAQRRPPSASRNRPGGLFSSNADPKQAIITKFYEDLTNLLVPHMKPQNGKYLDIDDWLLSCVFTHRDVTDENSEPKSLQFNLRLCCDLKNDATEPVVSPSQLVDSVHYMPLNLENESEEFIESLGFLKTAFTFERHQLSLFARTLHDFMSGEGGDTQAEKSESDADSVQLLE